MATKIRHHHSALHVRSLERSASFYVDGLGLKRVQEWRSGPYIGEMFARPGVGVSALMLATEDDAFQLELVQVDDPPPAVDPSQASPGTAHLAFTGIDVAEVFDRMMSLGYGSLSRPVAPSSGPNAGGLLVYLLDPDGNRVELIQPPNWNSVRA
ncbi:VOC family protein [Pedococcus sp. 5OH_020]|uniref:VOC family protein n=1 Tax=Pedococcus sp. 5OH_020 TaxID=2989814 RepID=UPI0022E99EB9|nr:VOC family protein [Pedococcus sp. 5OH_020]